MAQSYPPTPPAPVPPAPGQPAPYQQAPYQPAPAPQIKFAGFLPRLIAYIIDGIIAGIVMVILLFVLGMITAAFGANGNDFLAGIGMILMLLIVFGVSILYFPFFWARSGQTPGMKVMRVRVVHNDDGSPIGWGTALVRLFGYWVSAFVFYIGFIWIFFDERKRGWHDLIAGTCVIEV